MRRVFGIEYDLADDQTGVFGATRLTAGSQGLSEHLNILTPSCQPYAPSVSLTSITVS